MPAGWPTRCGPRSEQVAYILIDTPPSLGLLTVNALTAADAVIVPVECRYLAMRGIRAILDTLGTVRERLNPSLDLLGLLPTMYQPRRRTAGRWSKSCDPHSMSACSRR